MELYIPPLGTKLQLTRPWTFLLHGEYRNHTLFTHLGIPKVSRKIEITHYRYHEYADRVVTLPSGTVLTVDRIYIRKGGVDFNSVTFFLPKEKRKQPHGIGASGKAVRFWVKLASVNTIICDIIE